MNIATWLKHHKSINKRASKKSPFVFIDRTIIGALEKEEQSKLSANPLERKTILCKGILNNNFF